MRRRVWLDRKEHFVQTFLYRKYNRTKLIAINRVDGKAEPIPSGEIARRKTIPPTIPIKKRVLFMSRKMPTRIWPEAIKETINDV